MKNVNELNVTRNQFYFIENSTGKSTIVHIGIFYFKKLSFVTFIDKLTKFASAYETSGRKCRSKKTVILQQSLKYGKLNK